MSKDKQVKAKPIENRASKAHLKKKLDHPKRQEGGETAVSPPLVSVAIVGSVMGAGSMASPTMVSASAIVAVGAAIGLSCAGGAGGDSSSAAGAADSSAVGVGCPNSTMRISSQTCFQPSAMRWFPVDGHQ